MKENNSKLVAVLLALAAIVVVVVSLLIGKNNNYNSNITVVNDASQFFTVNSCLYRVTNYVYNKNTDALIKVLTDKYKKNNKINENNVLDKFPKINEASSFVSKKMFYTKISNDITKYYVYGIIRPNVLHDYTAVEENNEEEVYFVVILDSSKQIFSIEPYDGKIFMDGDNGE